MFIKKIEELKKLIESLQDQENLDKALCFFGWNDGRKCAERLYICYESNINLYSKLLHYEPLIGKMIKNGMTKWDEVENSLRSNESNYIPGFNTVRLIHGEYPATGMDTDHGAQVCKFDSLEELMNDITALDRGEIGHCMLANPQSSEYSHHAILTKEQMFKDAIFFGNDRENWKFLFEWGDDVKKKCDSYIIPALPKEIKQKDQRYYDLKRMKYLIEKLLELDPNDEVKDKLPKVLEELGEYE